MPPPLPAYKFLVPNSVDQGATFPCQESVLASHGTVHTLLPIFVGHLLRNKVQCELRSEVNPTNQKGVGITVSIVERMEVGYVYWNRAQIERKYNGDAWFTRVMLHRELPGSYYELHVLIARFAPDGRWPTVLTDLMEWLIAERGADVPQSDRRLKCHAPVGYVPFVEKSRRAAAKGVPVPPVWLSSGPDDALVMRLMSHPIGVKSMKSDSAALNPTGSGWYPILVIRYRKRARGQDGKLYTRHMGAWCVDQLLNEDTSGVVGWSLENLDASQLSAGVKEGVGQDTDHSLGEWVRVEDLMDQPEVDELGFAVPDNSWTDEWMCFHEAGLRYSPFLDLWVDSEGRHLADPSDPSQQGVFTTIPEGNEDGS